MMTIARLLVAPYFTTLAMLVGAALPALEAHALNSCTPSPLTAIVSFSQGAASDGGPIEASLSNPTVLLGAGNTGAVALGIGGSLTVSFAVPLANYPAAGAPKITRPTSAAPCSTQPTQATIFGSMDGISFVELGVTCEGGEFSLGDFAWVSHLRIVDTTDRTHPAFISSPSPGFTLRSLSGPGCLKYSHCAHASTLDPALANSTTQKVLSLGTLGDDFSLAEGAVFEEYGNGSARFSGSLSSIGQPDKSYAVVLSFTGRVTEPPATSPALLLRPSAYVANGGPIDPSQWFYYKTVGGSLHETSPQEDQLYAVNGTTHALQVGMGADGRSGARGASTSIRLQLSNSETAAEIAFTLGACPTITPTPSASPSPTPPAEPTGSIEDSSEACALMDLTDTLATLDQALLKRGEIVFKAARATVHVAASQSNLTFQTQRRARARTLATEAWAAIWQHPWGVLRCPNTTACDVSSLLPLQEKIRAAVERLDSYVITTISNARKRASARSKRSLFKKLRSEQSALSREFERTLGKFPTENFTCPSASSVNRKD